MSGKRKLWLVGCNHRSAPIQVREQLAFQEGAVSGAVRNLLGVPGIEEGALVSTCNRVEVIACGDETSNGGTLTEFLAREHGLSPTVFAEHIYVHEDRHAVRHLFRVASSLDSLVVGEPQILGQLKTFYDLAAKSGTAGAILHKAFHKAFSVAKRVRTETGIGGRNVSVSSVAVDLATQIFESLTDKTAMVIGAGKMSELTARHLQGRGIGSMMFANRTFDRAVEMAREYRGTPVPFEELARYLVLADVVLGSTAAAGFLLNADELAEVQRERNNRPMFLIDLAVPRNFDPRINQLENVYLYDIDDLEAVTAENLGEREREAERAEAIVDEEVHSFWRWYENRDVVPTIVKLREKLDGIRNRELQRTFGALPGLGEEEKRAIQAMTEAMVNKILHRPISRLKRNAPDSDDVVVARRLFGLDDGDDRDD